ncbi:MAG: DNA methyltransferase [Terriglobales bacterium]
MAKIDITKTELVWPGKYNEDGTLKEVPKADLPFQVIETVNESRATREVQKITSLSLFDVYEGKEGDTFSAGWRNKLIWGDNLLVMASLREKFAGKVDLIYIDPPFLTGADFSHVAPIGEAGLTVDKPASLIEEKVYRDTWGHGLESYMGMLAPRIRLIWDLLADGGNLFLHIGPSMSHNVRMLCDDTIGSETFRSEIVWQRHDPHNDAVNNLGIVTDRILWYGKGTKPYYDSEVEREELSESAEAEFSLLKLPDGSVVNWKGNESKTGRRFKLENATWKGTNPKRKFVWRGAKPSPKREWMYDKDEMEAALASGELYLRNPDKGAARCWVRYLDENKGILLQDLWTAVGRVKGGSDYPTQKPERLLERIVKIGSKEGSLVCDFFAGSGTTMVAAENSQRRWIGCDLSRWGVHIARKRLLDIEDCKPFEVLNLGKYERQYWQGVTFGGSNGKPLAEQALYEYLAFILKLYGAQPVVGLEHLHGKKGKAMIHIGAVDAPVTIAEIDTAVEECAKLKQSELHVLGWEWEMGLYDLMVEAAKKKRVKLLLLLIPHEVMEQQAADKGDVHFFELAYLEAEIKQPKKLAAQVSLKDFVIPNTDLIPEDVRNEVKKWSDYVDYWAVDWDFRNDTFMQGWVAYRTRKERKLALQSDSHTYEKAGKYRILVKVIDIFGNDTSQAFDVEVK